MAEQHFNRAIYSLQHCMHDNIAEIGSASTTTYSFYAPNTSIELHTPNTASRETRTFPPDAKHHITIKYQVEDT
ncbi:hypothetical protein CJ030_MR3G025383 [Morella rubra]|uniref:Uncharacterized protein n=1 Tax=Morella rubra TaxID=262757 RepID=A0A6A1W9C8_9ROSI|nr:hypothetical protein CJ030_MR3G025383 [Morella rubra]